MRDVDRASCARFLVVLIALMLVVGCGDDGGTADAAVDADIHFDAEPPPPDGGAGSTCGDPEELMARTAMLRSDFEEITSGVAAAPIDLELPEDTTGTLELGFNPTVFPLLAGDHGVRAAASTLGEGRIVAFSGQDFLSSQERSTLLGIAAVDTLIQNATRWVSPSEAGSSPRILADNQAIADVLTEGDFADVSVASLATVAGLWETRDWTSEALEGVDIAVVQVNEWGTLHVESAHIEALRAFVMAGGGLIISGSALHWSWWLSDTADRFTGDLIVEGSGLSWQANSERDLRSARIAFDAVAAPEALWCAYLAGDSLTGPQLTRLAPFFNGAKEIGRVGEVNTALMRLLRETPALPTLASVPEARLSADVASTLAPHEWPAPHPWTATFPGSPTTDAVMDGEVDIDVSWSRFQPLGFYAPPGRVVTVEVSEADVGTGFAIQVGELYDDLRSIGRIEMWRRAPHLRRHFEVTAAETSVGNTYGGAIYLVVPAHMMGTVHVEVRGAIPMAVFTRGRSTVEAFSEDLSSGAPQAILQEHGRIRMVVPTEDVRRVADPDEVVEFWSGFHASHADLAQEPMPRLYESHWIFDPQVGYGYANATRERITFPALSIGWALRTQTGDEDWWLFGHELGHQFQTSDWRGGDITEVAVNLFTMYTLNDYVHGGHGFETIGFEMNTIDHEALRTSRWETADLFGKLQLYRQLIFEFGWERVRETFASYYSEDYPVSTYGEFMDGFAIRFSAIVSRDLASFFEHWEYPMSEEAAASIRGFGHPEWLPPGW